MQAVRLTEYRQKGTSDSLPINNLLPMGPEWVWRHVCALRTRGCVYLEQSSICDIRSLNEIVLPTAKQPKKTNYVKKKKKRKKKIDGLVHFSKWWRRDSFFPPPNLQPDLGGERKSSNMDNVFIYFRRSIWWRTVHEPNESNLRAREKRWQNWICGKSHCSGSQHTKSSSTQ